MDKSQLPGTRNPQGLADTLTIPIQTPNFTKKSIVLRLTDRTMGLSDPQYRHKAIKTVVETLTTNLAGNAK